MIWKGKLFAWQHIWTMHRHHKTYLILIYLKLGCDKKPTEVELSITMIFLLPTPCDPSNLQGFFEWPDPQCGPGCIVRNNAGLIPSIKGLHRFSHLFTVYINWIVPVSVREISLIYNGKFPTLDGIGKRDLLYRFVWFSFW